MSFSYRGGFRRRVRDMQFGKIENMSSADCNVLAYYFYKICHLIKNCDREDVINLLGSLCDNLDKDLQLENVLSLHLEKMVRQDRLHLSCEDSVKKIFECKETMKYHFVEDAYTSRDNGFNSAAEEIPINVARCLSYGGDNILAQIICQAFFAKEQIEFADEDVNVPKSVIKNASSMSKIKFISDAINLSKDEEKLLLAMYRLNCSEEFMKLIRELIDEDLYKAYSAITGIATEKIEELLDESSTLQSYSLIYSSYAVQRHIVACIRKRSLAPIFEECLKEADTSASFDTSSFSVPAETTSLVKNMLRGKMPVSLLLYGAAGAGKTEFAKAVAKECGLKAVVFENISEFENEDRAINRLNFLLSIQKEDSVIIIDEAENILETTASPFGTKINTASKKGTINKMFDANRNKVIWIVNYTNSMDESTRRRFTYSVKFDEMPEKTLRNIAQSKFQKLGMSDDTQEKVIDLCGKYHVTGASVDNVAKALLATAADDENELLANAASILEANSTLIYGKPKMREKVSENYDAGILNVSMDAEEIVAMIKNAQRFSEQNGGKDMGIRMLFYGASGTGKTEFARYIAESLNKNILLKRASDILGKYVGDNEKHIKDAFAEAESTGKILLFDEADSFFADRNSAARSWERTMVNEFLTQMEEFSGILICTTNLRNIMDAAMQRRFHILAEFKPLKTSGIKSLLKKYFSKYDFNDADVARLARTESVTPGDFGSLYGKIRFMPSEKINSGFIIEELEKIQSEKNGGSTRRIGFVA